MLSFVSKYAYNELKAALGAVSEVIELDDNPNLRKPEAAHPDLQLFACGSDILLAEGITTKAVNACRSSGYNIIFDKIGPDYPESARLDAALCGNYLIHRLSVTSPYILNFADKMHFVKLDVKQGYTGCRLVYIPRLDLAVTGDMGIYKALRNNSFNAYLVDDEIIKRILLPGFGNGFLGGCTGYCSETDTLFVNGSFSGPLFELSQIIRQSGTKIVETGGPLMDIGGIKFI